MICNWFITNIFNESLYIIMVTSSIDRVIGETGTFSQLDHNSQTILLDRNYDNPVIFTQPLSYNGTQPAIVRIEDIKGDRFTASIQEPRNHDGKHLKESFSYIVLEEGTWQLEDDTVLEVGTVETDLLAPNGWENIEFTHDFVDNPLTFSSVQTDNDSDFVRTRQRNTSTDGFQITMEEEEAFNNSGHGEETVGWLAISAGSGSWSQNSYLAGTTGDKITHNWHTIDFGNNFSQSPVVLSSIASYDGGDASGLRYSKLSSDRIDIKIEEDTTRDLETMHTSEVVNFLALAGNSPLRGLLLEENTNADEEDEENWDVVYDGLNQNEPLYIEGMKNVLIKNSTFKNIKDSNAIYIKNSNNVHIENVTVENLSGIKNLSGIRIHDSTNVTVEDSTISKIFSPEHSAGIKITGGKSANITLDNNHIYNTYGNGIVSDGTSSNTATQTVHDTPVPGLKITDNLIHDIGKTPTPISASPTHGMYIKAQDPYVARNTVYNSFDGQGISLRSTATVINNKVWDTKLPAVGFSQMKLAGNSKKSIFKNNLLFFTKDKPGGDTYALLDLNWNDKSKYPLRYDNFEIRNNKFSICSENSDNSSYLIKLYPFDNLNIVDNDFVDRRERKRFLGYRAASSVRYEEEEYQNSFNESSCLNK